MSQYFSMLYGMSDWTMIFYIFPCVVIASFVYGYFTMLTAKRLGCTDKVSLNPLKYIDIIGFIFQCIIGFGWAKSTQVNIDKLTKGKKVLYHLSGPIANIAAAMAALVVQAVLMIIFTLTNLLENVVVDSVLALFNLMIWINFMLAMTHIIPIPPFSGYKVLKVLFFEKIENKNIKKVEETGKLVFVTCAVIGVLSIIAEIPVQAVFNLLTDVQEALVDFITDGRYSAVELFICMK